MAYADPNYDPQAAHEYYEKHKKLKGKKSTTKAQRNTKGMNKTQREQWAFARAQLFEEKKKRTEELKAGRKGALAALSEAGKQVTAEKQEITKRLSESQKQQLELIAEQKQKQKEQIQKQATQKIEALRNKLKNLPPEQRQKVKEQIQKSIDKIKTGLKKSKDKLSADTQARKEDIRADISGQKQSAANKAAESKALLREQRKGVSEAAKGAAQANKEEYEKALDAAYKRIRG